MLRFAGRCKQAARERLMEESFRAKYYRLEEDHWWSIARRDMIARLLEELTVPRAARIVDIGCSSGPQLKALRAAGYTNAVGVDLSPLAVRMCRDKGLEALQLDGADLSFEDGEIDMIIASDILEHIEDDRAALSEWYRVLRPGGHLIVFVPAFMFLWSAHDAANGHHRRYRQAEVEHMVASAGFIIERSTFWNLALFIPTATYRILKRGLFGADEAHHDLKESHPLVRSVLARVMTAENRLFARGPRVGMSVLLLARR